MDLSFEIWVAVKNGYTTPTISLVDVSRKKLSENNVYLAMNAILCGLGEYEFVKVINCKSTKDIWDKLQNIYEVDNKVPC